MAKTAVTIIIEHPDECDPVLMAARFLGSEHMSEIFDGHFVPETDPYHSKHQTQTVMVGDTEVMEDDWYARNAYYYDKYHEQAA